MSSRFIFFLFLVELCSGCVSGYVQPLGESCERQDPAVDLCTEGLACWDHVCRPFCRWDGGARCGPGCVSQEVYFGDPQECICVPDPDAGCASATACGGCGPQ